MRKVRACIAYSSLAFDYMNMVTLHELWNIAMASNVTSYILPDCALMS